MKTNKLDSIQFLRGIAALLVIAFHFRQYLNDVYAQKNLGDILFGLGEVGVDIFFVISGFIITYSTTNKEKNTPLEFSIKRFFRLYPVLFITLTLLIVLNTNETYSLVNIIKSYLLIPIDYNFIGPWYGYNINLPAWTLTYEILFYAIFCVSLLISHKYRTIIAILLIISICSLSQFYFRGFLQLDPITRDLPTDSFINNFRFLSNPIIYDFIFGMIIAEFFLKIKESYLINRIPQVILVSIFWLSVCVIISGYHRGGGVERWGLYSFFLVGSLVFLSKSRDIKFSSFWVMMGEMSYSLYINHMIVKKLTAIYFRNFGIYSNGGGATLFFILMILTFVMSYITYNFIEKPSVKLGRDLADRIRLKKVKAS